MSTEKAAGTPSEDTMQVLVVGGGLSGLTCAREILARGKKTTVTVLEASDRVGGRTLSEHVSGVRVDLGGQWVAPKVQQPRMHLLCARLRLKLHAQHFRGKRILDLRGVVHTYATDIPTALSVLALLTLQMLLWRIKWLATITVGRLAPEKRPELDRTTVAVEAQRLAGRWDDVLDLITAMVRGVFGCEPKDLSWLHLLHYCACAGGVERLVKVNRGFQENTIVGGSQQVSEALADEVRSLGGRIEMRARVTCIDTSSPGAVCIRGEDGREWYAQRVVLATPPSNLKGIQFEPTLPASRVALNRSAFMGCIIKSIAVYPTAFWRRDGFSGEVVADTAVGPVFNCYDHTVEMEGPGGEVVQHCMLVCFINGDAAREWSRRTCEERREAVVSQLVRWFGEEAKFRQESEPL
eukprot:gene14848-17553_t